MRTFNHINAASLTEATKLLKQPGAVAMAGGGDLLGALKDDIFEEYPKLVVNLKTIRGRDGVEVKDGYLELGALNTLANLSRNELVQKYAPIVAEAAGQCASPALRETTTLGGNLCQLPRCWYFRKLENRFDCARKGGERCFAFTGDNRYHSVFGPCVFTGADKKNRLCLAVNQAELAPVLCALNAEVVTTKRTVPATVFFAVGLMCSTVLKQGEIVTAVRVPLPKEGQLSRYQRFSFRKSIDFPVINLAFTVIDGQYRIWFGGVAPLPWHAEAAEAVLNGQTLTPEVCEQAGNAAIKGASPTEANAYKLQLMRTLLKRELQKL